MSSVYYSTLSEIKAIYAQSAEQKMARFLLGLSGTSKVADNRMQVMLEVSQEEIGQMVGLSAKRWQG